MKLRSLIVPVAILLCTGVAALYAQHQQNEKNNPYYKEGETGKVNITDAQWKKVLTPKVYNILREKGTEAPDTGPNAHNYSKGMYYCAACGNPLFTSATKFDSHTGWPSFYQPLKPTSVMQAKDNSLGMERDEVMCAKCGGHLGHVFDDGPAPTHLRYCMNGYAMVFEPAK